MRNKYKGADIKARLCNTLIRWDGKPVFCKTTGDGTILNLFSLERRNELVATVEPDDPKIDISSITLGYLNFEAPVNCAVLVRRLPRRIYKQGIDINYLEYKPVSTKYAPGHIDSGYMLTPSVYQSLIDSFPTLQKAIVMMKGPWESVALSKDIAIKKEDNLFKFFIKGSEVGYSRSSDPSNVIISKNEISWINSMLLTEIKGISVTEGLKNVG